jgi:hypothetical protein
MDAVTRSLASLSIAPAAHVSHSDTTSPATWREALDANTSTTPLKPFELIKTLVYKPKTAKTATPIPVVVIARDDTETNSAAIGKKLNLKDMRLASEDLLTEFFSLDKNSRRVPLCYSARALFYPSSISPGPRPVDLSKGRHSHRLVDRILLVPFRCARFIVQLHSIPVRKRHRRLSSASGN